MKRELGPDAGASGMGGAKRPRQDNRGRDITLRFLLQSKVSTGIVFKGHRKELQQCILFS